MQTRGACFFYKPAPFTFTAERKEPSSCTAQRTTFTLSLKKISKFEGKKADDFLEWSFHASCQSQHLQNDHLQHLARAIATVGDRPQSGHRSCGVGCRRTGYIQHAVLRRATQSSSSDGERARHSRTERDMNSKRGRRCVRSSKGVAAKRFARSMPRLTTRQCDLDRTPTSTSTLRTAAATAFTACDPSERQHFTNARLITYWRM